MRIQHNIMAMNAYRNYSNNTSALSKNLEKLSSGYKINRAGDDAAGLAISEKMRAQITGLETAQKNAKDGISLIQTAEGALTEVHDMLNRMVELADQSANGTYDNNVDRDNLQKEFDALRDEIDRISKATNFNGINLLDGTRKTTTDTAALIAERLSDLDVNGVQPNAAGTASITVQLDKPEIKIDGIETSTGTKINETAATANKWVSGAMAQTGGAGENFDLTVKYNDAEGNAQTKKLTIATGAAAADTFKNIQDAVAADADLKGLFEVKGAASGIEFHNKTAGKEDNLAVTGLEIKNTGAGGVTIGASAVGAVDEFTHTFTNTDNTLAAGDSITIGDQTFTITGSGGDDTGTNISLDTAATIDAALTEAAGRYGPATADGYTAAYNSATHTLTMTADAKGTGSRPSVSINVTDTSGASTATTAAGAATNVTTGANEVVTTGAGTSTAGKDAHYDLTTVLASDGGKLTINGKTYTKAAVNDDDAREFTTLAELKTQLAADGIALGGTGATDATFSAASITADNAIDALDITTGTTTYKDLADAVVDGKKVSELFTIKVNGTEIDPNGAVDGAKIFAQGDKIEFIAKTPGKLSDTVMDAFNYTSGADVTRVEGNDEGKPSNASKATYELTFDFDKIAGGQHFTIGNTEGKSKTFEFTLDGTLNTGANSVAINIDGMDPKTEEGKLAIAKAIQAAVSGAMGDFKSDEPKAADVAGSTFELTIEAKNAGTDSNLGAVRISESAAAAGAVTGVYNAASAAAEDRIGTFAEVSYTLDLNKLAEGDKINIGGKEIEIVADADEDIGSGKLGLTKAKTATGLVDAFESNGYTSGKITIADGKLTIKGTEVGQTAADLAGNTGKVTFTAKEEPKTTGGLTLQIGDTSDDYNQLTVSIDSMDCASLGIDKTKINIKEQGDAQKAVKILKDAINSVSGTRGNLGALQNRLEHTINNLSVMQENIQDAEATIRDVDVAKEMMAYTKNNILVQSAQAMLAQANQVPQGVLQLLQ